MRSLLLLLPFLSQAIAASAYDLTAEQRQVPLEVLPTDPAAVRIVLIAGEASNKPGQHEYFAGCALLRSWLEAVPGVAPALVAGGWPQNEAVLDGARCVVFFMDGGDKLAFATPERRARVEALAASGAGLVILHQGIDCPPDLRADFLAWFGAHFDGAIGGRGHWDVSFDNVPAHDITRGLTPFPLLKDGWLYNLRFAAQGVTPILACQMPESSRKTEDAKAHLGRDEVVAWSYDRPAGGRSFGFTGCDLHANWAEPNQRRLLLNAILWTAGLPVPDGGMDSTVTEEDLKRYWDRKVFLKPKAKAVAP